MERVHKSLPKIRKIVSFVLNSKYSSFYLNKYKGIDIDVKVINSSKDFEKIPFLTKKEIGDVPPNERVYVSAEKIGCWLRTSGTTSQQPLLMPASFVKSEHMDILAEALSTNKVSKYLSLRPLSMLSIDMHDFKFHPKLKVYPLILGDITDLSLASKIASSLEVEGIDTTPSALYFLIPFLKEVYDLDRIKFIRLGGEFTSKQRLDFFKSYFKNAYFHFDMGSTEARGSIAVRCKYLSLNFDPSFYHPKTHFLYEVVDSHGNQVDYGSEGELVLTSLYEGAFPLVRYKTGEGVKIKKFNCECGRDELMELSGRIGYDFVRIGGVTLYRHLIEEAIEGAMKGKFEGDYELHVYEEIYKNRLVPKLHLKVSAKIKNPPFFVTKFEKKFKVGSNIFLDKLVGRELFAPTTIEQVKEFKESYKKIKIISHLK